MAYLKYDFDIQITLKDIVKAQSKITTGLPRKNRKHYITFAT